MMEILEVKEAAQKNRDKAPKTKKAAWDRVR
jgi:hypothetical protein